MLHSTDRFAPSRTLLAPLPLYFTLLTACAAGEELGDSRGVSPASSATDATTGADSGADAGGDSSGSEVGQDTQDGTALAVEVQSMLKVTCGGCHGPDSKGEGGIDYITDLTALVSNKKIVPEKPEESRLYARTSEDSMPPPAVDPRLTPAQVETIRQWILAGAPPPPTIGGCADNAFIDVDHIVAAMNDDIRDNDDHDAEDRPFLRYLTLSHLHNSGACAEELKAYEQAISKLVNSLSQDPVITRPVVLDDPATHGTILRIDIRDYRWDAVLWEEIVSANPFSVKYAGAVAEDLVDAADTSTPFQSADSFLQTVSRGDLYYKILGIPDTVVGLEILLGIDPNDLATGELLRTGFQQSGVSNFNRAFDRHEIPSGGAYYRSFDFDNESGFSNIFEHPLDFVAGGGEIIYNLPNGLQAYMLADKDGDRLALADTSIVTDPNQSDFKVKNGISCITCHASGIIPKDDEILDFVLEPGSGFGQIERDSVKDIYGSKDERLQTQEDDAGVFLTAVAKAGVSITEPEPIIRVSLDFEAPLDMRRAAAELGLPEEDLRENLVVFEGLGKLRDGGTVTRAVFEAAFAANVCKLVPGVDASPACDIPG